MLAALSVVLAASALTSCFTGVEGTKKISLSRDDKKTLEPSEEERFFRPVAGEPLKDWEKGRQFIASDDKTLIIFQQEGLPFGENAPKLGGKTLYYEGVEKKMAADGSDVALIVFTDGNLLYRHDTGKPLAEVMEKLTSDKIPMLIDLKMVESARNLLVGKKIWTKSPLWYDSRGNRITGRKFVPVTVTDVEPGTLVFPLRLRFTDENGYEAYAFMNFGNSGKESRSFPNLFLLSDLRNRYPTIEDDVWELITYSQVKAGMTKEECKLSLGNPTEVDSGHDYTQTLDLWHYTDGSVLWFEDGLLTRYRR